VRVFGWSELEPVGSACEFRKSLLEKRWTEADEQMLAGYREIFLLDTVGTVQANRVALFGRCAASVLERVRQVVFLDWKPSEPQLKVSESFTVFSDPKLLELVGVKAPEKLGGKFAVDSTAIPRNLELQSWSNCVVFEK